MQAINYYIIVEKIKMPPKKVGGLEIMESQDKDTRYLKGKVISSGDKVEVVNPDDIVWYDKHAGHGIQFDDKLYYVINIGDIVIVE